MIYFIISLVVALVIGGGAYLISALFTRNQVVRQWSMDGGKTKMWEKKMIGNKCLSSEGEFKITVNTRVKKHLYKPNLKGYQTTSECRDNGFSFYDIGYGSSTSDFSYLYFEILTNKL